MDCFKMTCLQCHNFYILQAESEGRERERKRKISRGGRFLCFNHENNTQHLYHFLVALQV